MANDYIRKRDAVDALAKTMPTPATPDGAGEFDHEIHIADEAFADAIRIIESLEPADVVPVAHAHWYILEYESLTCSRCGGFYYCCGNANAINHIFSRFGINFPEIIRERRK